MDSVPAWGVDLCTYALRAVKVDVGDSGRPRIIAWDIVDFAEEVEDLTDLARFHVMSRALNHFLSRHDLAHSRVYVTIRGETAFNRTVVIPPVTDESLDRLLDYEAQQQIPFPLEDVFWDRRVLSIREDGEIHASIYAVRRSIVEDTLRRLSKNRFPVDGLQLRPIALHNFCAAERYVEPGTIVVSVDYGGLMVLIYEGEQLWFRCLPVGGIDFTSAIQKTFGVDHRKAVMMASGQARIADKQGFLACREESGRQIAEEAARLVRYYQAARPGLRSQGIVLLRMHPTVPPLAPVLKELLGQPVHRPKGFRHMEVSSDVVTAGIQEHFHALTVAAGCALQGIDKAEIDIRLYPPDLKRELYGGRVGYVLAAVLLLALLATVGLLRYRAADEVDQEARALLDDVSRLKTVSELRKQFDSTRTIAQLEALARPAEGKEGHLPLVDGLWEAVWAFEDQKRAPRIVALSFGEKGNPKASLVLAVTELDGEDQSRARLQRVLDALRGKGLIGDARPVATWIGGESSEKPPEKPPERPFRIRLIHVRYELDLRSPS